MAFEPLRLRVDDRHVALVGVVAGAARDEHKDRLASDGTRHRQHAACLERVERREHAAEEEALMAVVRKRMRKLVREPLGVAHRGERRIERGAI